MTEQSKRPADEITGPDQAKRELEKYEAMHHELLRKQRNERDTAHDDIPLSERFSR